MNQERHYYLISVQYLGFRYHGWQKQPGVKTVQSMIDKTLAYVLGDVKFKTLGASRTDAMVSVNKGYLELFVWEKLDIPAFQKEMAINLPHDIRILSVEEVDEKFNVIQDVTEKEYIYLFSHGEKPHPFAASLMTGLHQQLDIEQMKAGAKMFEGTHSFACYCTKPKPETVFDREINLSEIVKNDKYTASFFPEESYLYRVRSKGFLRYQVRWMMGALFALGRGAISLEQLQRSLESYENEPIARIAPASGLILNNIDYGIGRDIK